MVEKKRTIKKAKSRAYESFFQQKSLDPIRDLDLSQNYGEWDSSVKAYIDIMTLKGLFTDEDWVYILVNKYASRIAMQRMRVYKKVQEPSGDSSYKPADDHPVQLKLDNPNTTQTRYDYIYSYVADHILTGNAITWKQPATGDLVCIPVQMVDLDFDHTANQLKSYRIVKYVGYEGLPNMGEMKEISKIDPSEIGHSRRPNPFSVYWGMSPFIPGRRSLLFNRYSTEFLINFYQRGAQPGLAFEMGEGANERDCLRTLVALEKAHHGRNNQRKSMVVPKGMKLVPVTTSLADQQLKDYIDKNREVIINILEVPKHELSIADSGSLGSQEYKTALKSFWRGPLKSVMDSIALSHQKLFKQELGPDYIIEFDLSEVEVLQEDLKEKAMLAREMLSTHSPNEVRAKLYQDPPIQGGENLQSAQPVQSFQQFSAKPIETQSIVDVIETAKVTVPSDEKRLANVGAFTSYKSKNPLWWDEREKELKENFDKANTAVFKNFLNTIADQAENIIGILKKNLKDEKAVKPIGSKQRLKQEIKRSLDNFESVYVDGNIEALAATINVGYDSMLKVPFNLPDTDKIEAIKLRNAEKRKAALEDRQVETFVRINETTANNILTTIDVGIEQGKTIQEIIRDVATQMTDVDVVKGRAETIARTETLTASSLGQAAAMKDAAEVIPNLKKIWLNAGDDRVRDTHERLQGEAISHKDKFSNGLEFPRDPGGEAAEVINCRCTMIFLTAEAAKDMGIEDLHGDID